MLSKKDLLSSWYHSSFFWCWGRSLHRYTILFNLCLNSWVGKWNLSKTCNRKIHLWCLGFQILFLKPTWLQFCFTSWYSLSSRPWNAAGAMYPPPTYPGLKWLSSARKGLLVPGHGSIQGHAPKYQVQSQLTAADFLLYPRQALSHCFIFFTYLERLEMPYKGKKVNFVFPLWES